MPLGEFGRYGVLTALIGLCGCVADLGIPSGIVRDYYDRHRDSNALKLSSNALLGLRVLMLIMLPVLGIVLFEFWPLTVHNLGHTVGILLTILCITYFERLAEALGGVARAMELPRYFVLARATSAVSAVVLAIVIVVGLAGGVFGAMIVRAIAAVLSFVACQLAMNRDLDMGWGRFDLAEIKSTLRFGLPLLPARLGGWGQQQALRPVLSQFVPMTAVGLYSFASAIAFMPLMLTNAVELALAPIYYKRRADQIDGFENKVEIVSMVLAAGQFSIWLALALFSGEIVSLIAGPRYANAAPVAALLFCAGFARGLNPFLARQIQFLRKTWLTPSLSLPCAALSLALTIVFCGEYGLRAAAWAVVASEMALLALMVFAVRFYERPNLPVVPVALLAVALLGLVMTAGPGGYFVLGVFGRACLLATATTIVAMAWIWPNRALLVGIVAR
jgi:O-antigen/teichoic acid export membrane protein